MVDLKRKATRSFRVYAGGDGSAQDETLIESDSVDNFNTFMLKSSAGGMYVEVDIGDGVYVGPISLGDLGATIADPVVATAPGRLYGFRGNYDRVRVRQAAGANVTGAVLRGYMERGA